MCVTTTAFFINLSLGGLDPSIIPRTDILIYNPDTESWTKTSDMTVGRYQHEMTTVAWDDMSQFCPEGKSKFSQFGIFFSFSFLSSF